LNDELKELRKIARILILANSDTLTKILSRYATTDERKMIWVLIDGVNMPKDIAKKVGKIKRRAVEIFLEELEQSKLVENPKRKPPTRLIDFVPPAWMNLLKKRVVGKEKKVVQ